MVRLAKKKLSCQQQGPIAYRSFWLMHAYADFMSTIYGGIAHTKIMVLDHEESAFSQVSPIFLWANTL